MKDLIEKIKAATAGAEAIDAEIVAALNSATVRPYPPSDDFGPKDRWQFWSLDGKHFLGSEHKFKVLPYTRSVDAALTLVPDGCAIRIQRNLDMRAHWAEIQRRTEPVIHIESDNCNTLPIAICVAALHARAALPTQ